MLNIDTKRFLFFTLSIVFLFSIPHFSTSTFAQKAEEAGPLDIETLLGDKVETQREIPDDMKFQYKMAELLGEKVGPDDSGNVYHAGGLSSYYTGPEKLFPGKGKYGHLYNFLPVIRWYDPTSYYNSDAFHPGSAVEGEFTNKQCVTCHMVESPGIVTQWKQSKHAAPSGGKDIVGCDKCHGKNHKKLIMPGYDLCGECHEKQLKGHREGGSRFACTRLSF